MSTGMMVDLSSVRNSKGKFYFTIDDGFQSASEENVFNEINWVMATDSSIACTITRYKTNTLYPGQELISKTRVTVHMSPRVIVNLAFGDIQEQGRLLKSLEEVVPALKGKNLQVDQRYAY